MWWWCRRAALILSWRSVFKKEAFLRWAAKAGPFQSRRAASAAVAQNATQPPPAAWQRADPRTFANAARQDG